MSELQPASDDGAFAKLFGQGQNQVLLQLTVQPGTTHPIIVMTFDPHIDGMHTVSLVMEVNLLNPHNHRAVWHQMQHEFKKITAEQALGLADLHRAECQKMVAAQNGQAVQ